MSKNPLLDKLKKASTIKESSILETSKFFENKEYVTTSVPVFNVALSGDLDGGFGGGTFIISGVSRSFKTSFALLMIKSYMDTYPDAVLLFTDSEFGAPRSYFQSFGIDMSRVIHIPITTIEELKFELTTQLNAINRGDKVILLVDSVGMLPSEKESQNAADQKTTADLTRNRELKSLFRLTTTKLAMKDVPMIVISHSYKTLELYSKDVVSVGTGGYYASDVIIIVTRSQEKEGTDLTGYKFTINIEKSRFVKEKSKIPIFVSFEHGISKWSGLMDLALEGNFVIKPSNGWYQKINLDTGDIIEKKYRLKETNNKEFWWDIIAHDKFKQYIIDTYQISNGAMLSEGDIDELSDEDISEVFSDEE